MTVKMRGLLITFEGGEGSGKTTQIQRLKSWIEENCKGFSLCLTREPGGTEDAEAIRGLLLNGLIQKWQPATEAMLVSASRHEHVVHVIQPALQRGNIVICDCFTPVFLLTNSRCFIETTQPRADFSSRTRFQLRFHEGHCKSERSPLSAGGLRSMRIQGNFCLRNSGIKR